MITMTEKRLQELEGRIPVYEAKIAEQQAKLIEVYSYAKDLAELRLQFDELSKKFQAHQSVVSNEASAVQTRLLNHDKLHVEHAAKLGSASRANEHILEAQGKIQKDILRLCDESIALQSKSNAHLEVIGNHQKQLDVHKSSLDNSTSVFSVYVPRIMSLEKNVDILDKTTHEMLDIAYANMDKMSKSIDVKLAQQSQEISAKLAAQKMPELPQPINYDAQIADLKQDLASVLAVVHSSVSSNPDQVKINEKVKILESNMAQILQMMKKYG